MPLHLNVSIYASARSITYCVANHPRSAPTAAIGADRDADLATHNAFSLRRMLTLWRSAAATSPREAATKTVAGSGWEAIV